MGLYMWYQSQIQNLDLKPKFHSIMPLFQLWMYAENPYLQRKETMLVLKKWDNITTSTIYSRIYSKFSKLNGT